VRIRRVVLSIAHQLLCPYVLVVLTSFLTFCVVGLFHGTITTARTVLLATPFYPIQIGTALVAGYLVGHYLDIPFATRMWILPAALLFAGILLHPLPDGISRSGYWFGWFGIVGRVSPPLQVAYTLPFYVSAAYSLAATVAHRRKHFKTQGLSVESV
jgi:hypothetical protein